jgi:short-subunit dehydrogenase
MGFADSYGPRAVVLGASEGLGAAFAAGVAARGVNVVVAARRSDLLAQVAGAISNAHGVQTQTVTLDLAGPEFLEALQSATEGLEVGLAIYNATGVYTGEFEDQPVDSMKSMVAINCLGPLVVCEHFGRPMIARGRGGVVLMSSGAGLAGCPYNASYAASKAFDLVLGESLWAEWRHDGVDVMSVIGPTMDTPTYRANMPSEVVALTPPAMAPGVVVEEVLDAIGSCPSFVPGQDNRERLAALGALPRLQQVEALAAVHAGFAKRNVTPRTGGPG